MVTAGDFKKGLTVEWDGGVWTIVDFQHVKPGKGAAFVRTKIKNIMTGAVVERSFNPTDKMPKAIIETKEMEYLYSDGDLYYFMDNETYEQMPLTHEQVEDAIPYMKENKGGSIINIGSMASCGGDLGSTAYACAKAGVDMLTKSTALQYGKQNIRCNCVRPGLIVTPQNEAHVPQVLKDIFLSNIMVNRYGCPEDIGHMCVYLASDESSYVTGQVFTVDGGLNAHVSTVAQFRQLSSRTW